MIEPIRKYLTAALAVALCVFTVFEVNYARLSPLEQLVCFAMLGAVLCFIIFPLRKAWAGVAALRYVDLLLALLFVLCCAYLLWEGDALTNERVGQYTGMDHAVAILGTLLVLEATRRSIGLALPLLAGAFLLYAYFGASLPDWAFPHRGYDMDRISAQCFLGTKGVFGVAMRVMFTYVFLFVVFGAFLEMSGATQFIIDFSNRLFARSAGGPAKVSVVGSGLMGSLSGSAVANAVTTGSFTIPMMRSAGFQPHISGGITAAAASGGALVPPVMGAGAYMMLEIVEPSVDFMQIVRAALLPAMLYYLSILLIVHFYAKRMGSLAVSDEGAASRSLWQYEGAVFFSALGALLLFLFSGYTPFRAVTYSLEVIFLMSIVSPRLDVTRLGRIAIGLFFAVATAVTALIQSGGRWETLLEASALADAGIAGMLAAMLFGLALPDWRPKILEAFTKSARGGIALVSASGCVGIVMGVVTLTGVGTAFPNAVVPLAQESLLLALIAIMFCSLVLGMGLPSAVCYLLMAVLIGPVLNRLGVIPLAAHLFIFYFGMMSMVTPPVALAAYASASIAEARIMPTAMAAFRFALVGFTLPFMFVYRPALLLLDRTSWQAWMVAQEANDPRAAELLAIANATAPSAVNVAIALGAAVTGVVALAAGIAGYFRGPLSWSMRLLAILGAALLLLPNLEVGGQRAGVYVNIAGAILFGIVVAINVYQNRTPTGEATGGESPHRS